MHTIEKQAHDIRARGMNQNDMRKRAFAWFLALDPKQQALFARHIEEYADAINAGD